MTRLSLINLFTKKKFLIAACITETAMTQVSVQVQPTQTMYVLEAAGVQLTLTFSTPAFVAEPASLALPYTYITFNVSAIDGNSHNVQV